MTEIFEHKGNLLDVTEGLILHGCNNQGVMGSGIALSIKDKYPQVYQDYSQYIQNKVVARTPRDRMGKVVFTEIKHGKFYIASGITQHNYGRDSNIVYVDYEALAKVFKASSHMCQLHGLDMHFPLIGCGLANGDWNEVSKIININVSSKVRKHLWVLP